MQGIDPLALLENGLLAALASITTALITHANTRRGEQRRARAEAVQRKEQAAEAIEKRAAEVRAEERAGTRELIDQLQEELRHHRERQAELASLQDMRLERMEIRLGEADRLIDGYRTHAALLAEHIWKGAGPPPPTWPIDLPK